MFLLKKCIRCNGDMYIDDDYFGKFIKCLACGYTINLPEEKTKKVTTKNKPFKRVAVWQVLHGVKIENYIDRRTYISKIKRHPRLTIGCLF